MKSPLNILHIEDDPTDAALVQTALEAGGVTCAITRAQTRDDFVAALEHGGVDLILSDFTLPAFDGLSALKIAHATQPELPVIMLSGTLGEERAVDSLKNGATDYVLKGHLSRLVPAVRRAMLEVEERAERRRLEAQIVEAQKMEVVGHLASGVAHDFNNILAVIVGYSDMMMRELGPDNPLRKDVGEIQRACERAVGLTRQLLVFSRKATVQPAVLDLNAVVSDLDNMLRRLLDENIEMTIVPGKHVGRVKADSGYVGQVLMNLVVNARDAMPNGGQITIATTNVTLDENHSPCGVGVGTSPDGVPPLTPQGKHTHTGAVPGDYVMLSVSDTGTGMTQEAKARLFEPFFTTKPKGKGTGLGLLTCQTIVQQSGGHIGVYSEAGKGTTFKIFLPRVDLPLDTDTQFVKAGPLPRGTETLLLVEDEPSLRHLASGILEAQGYTLLRANNGQEGLRAAREWKGQPIRLVITDVIMPQMGGKVMAEWLKTTYPDLKILFTSGYTDDTISRHGVLEPGVAFLPKPYTPAALTHKVRAMLDNKADTTFLRKQDVTINLKSPGSK
jgi:two-component system, cell cycle sensor histidine kinase and response regulator CckA